MSVATTVSTPVQSLSIQPMSLDLQLPWSLDERQEQKFWRLLKRVLIALLILFVIVPWLPVFEAQYVEPEDKLIKTTVLLDPPEYDEPKPPPPPPVKPKPREVAPATRSNTQQPATSGAASLAALSSQLSALRQSVDVKRLRNKNVAENTTGKCSQKRTYGAG